jgi:hypothetical protein
MRTVSLCLAALLMLAACETSNQTYIAETYGDSEAQSFAHGGFDFMISDERSSGSLLIRTRRFSGGLFGRLPAPSEFRRAAAAYLTEARQGCAITDTVNLTDVGGTSDGQPVYEVFYAC